MLCRGVFDSDESRILFYARIGNCTTEYCKKHGKSCRSEDFKAVCDDCIYGLWIIYTVCEWIRLVDDVSLSFLLADCISEIVTEGTFEAGVISEARRLNVLTTELIVLANYKLEEV